MKESRPFTSIGGQAVIEGVMMRSPNYVVVAVRKPDHQILVRSHTCIRVTDRFPFLARPVLRGVTLLIESLIQGMDALSYSASIAASADEEAVELSGGALFSSLMIALVLGLGLFVALPHFLTTALDTHATLGLTPHHPVFHILDGTFKILILLTYIYAISWMKDIYRVFQYHGAEHKAIYTFEAEQSLSIKNALKQSTLHPRCGTSFLFFLILMSIAVFSIAFSVVELTELTEFAFLNHIIMIGIKVLLMFPIAGITYELIRASASRMGNPFFRVVIWPGLMLQRLTTREPSPDQLEVGLVALQQALRLEKQGLSLPRGEFKKEEIEISSIEELGLIEARVSEFPEI